jgi:DNA-binding PadR family transcriptional regulator
VVQLPDSAPPRPSPLGLTVLFMLSGGPLHPYEMQRRMKHWGKDQVVNVGQRANLYKTIDRLHQAGLIAVHKTERDQRFPERTVYSLTDAGLRVGREWLTDMLATPRNEFPRFPAALSFIFGLTPQEVTSVLERRVRLLREHLTMLEGALAWSQSGLRPPRVTLLETEYLRAVTAAELSWVSGVIDDLKTGDLAWSQADLAEAAKAFLPD